MYFRSSSPSTASLTLSLLTSIATAWTGIPQTTCPLWIMSNSGSFMQTVRWIVLELMIENNLDWAISDTRGGQMQCLWHCSVWGASKDRADFVAPALCPGVMGCWATQGSQGGWWCQELSDDLLIHSGPPQWSGHSQGSSAGHWLVFSIFWQFQTEQNSPGGNYKERACLWHLCLWDCHRCLCG